ncbi:MAG: AAA family ATPase [Bacillota bacterium]
MPFHIAVAGKGGTGKTTLAALTIRHLAERGLGPVLAVDADANSNLNEALGLEVGGTIADLLAGIKDSRSIPAGMTKDMYIEYRLNTVMAEGKHVDLLVMGGPEGPGCYCFPNDILKRYVQRLAANYRYLVMDNEAGLEHLSRRIAQDVDILLVTSDATARGVRSAGRVRALVDSLQTGVGRMYLVLTRAGATEVDRLRGEIDATGLELAGTIPLDPLVAEHDLEGKPLFDLPPGSLAVGAVQQLLNRVIA